MSIWRQFKRGVRVLTHRSAADRDVSDEVEHYLEQATAAHIARGLSPDQARRAARMELGNTNFAREQVRSYGWENVVETLFVDMRYAARRLYSDPGFTIIALLTLALGIGASTGIFSAVHSVLIESLPYPDANRLAMIWEYWQDGRRGDGTFGMYRSLAERSRSFTEIAVFKPWQPTMTGPNQPERLEGQRVTASFFKVLGVPPALGRDFSTAEDQLNGANVVILSAGFWRRRFGADRAIIGRSITLQDNPYTVIGVMPDRFENVLAPTAEVWTTLQYDMSRGSAWGHHLRTVGRLRPAVTPADATRELNALGPAILEEQKPSTYAPNVRFGAVPLQDDVTRAAKPALLAVLVAAGLVLVIACVNVTNLLIARGVHRRREFALRIALGASQVRLIRQLLTESLWLAALGGMLGLVVATLGVRALSLLSPPDLMRAGAFTVNATMFAVGLVVSAVIGVVFGLTPALQAIRSSPQGGLLHSSRIVTYGHRRARSALVIAEVSLAFVLLVGSGLLQRSLNRLFAIDSGFDPSSVLTMQVTTSGRRFADGNTTYQFFTQALDAVRQVPGVDAAALTSQLPLSGELDLYGVFFDPSPSNDPGQISGGTFRYAVSPGYIETMRIPLLRGRSLTDNDKADAPLVALISESIAKRRLPGLDPIGQRLRVGDGPLYTVVGVVGDVKQQSLAIAETDAVYTTAEQWRFTENILSLVVRTHGDPAALADVIRQAVWSVDKDQPISRVSTMEQLAAATAVERRFALVLFQAFAVAALVLAAAGIYGVISRGVVERTREIGVRSALGASRSNILTLMISQCMTLTGLGVLIGVVGASVATQAMVGLLFEVSPLDPATYLGMIAVLVVVALLACGAPAFRATRVDPAKTLRSE